MKRIAVYAGSFDPFTTGHDDIVRRGLKVVDEIIILISINPEKKSFMGEQEKLKQIAEVYKEISNVRVDSYHGLTGKYAIDNGASLLLRGIRNVGDMEYERNMSDYNKKQFGLETLFLFSSPELCSVSSSLVRQLASFGENYDDYLPMPSDILNSKNKNH